MRLMPIERLLKNMKQEIPSYMRREYLTREDAYEKIKVMTGQDFGMNVEQWEEWVKKQQAEGVSFAVSNGKSRNADHNKA